MKNKTRLAIAVMAALIGTTTFANADWYHRGWHRPVVVDNRFWTGPVVTPAPWYGWERHRGWWHRGFHRRWW